MKQTIWTPLGGKPVSAPGSPPTSIAPLPNGNLALADGRTLHHMKDIGLGQSIMGRVWGTDDGMRVIGSLDDTPLGKLLHVSISYAHIDPTWEEIGLVREAFYPADVDVMMMLPRKADYVNVHEHTFHLNQTPTVWGMR